MPAGCVEERYFTAVFDYLGITNSSQLEFYISKLLANLTNEDIRYRKIMI